MDLRKQSVRMKKELKAARREFKANLNLIEMCAGDRVNAAKELLRYEKQDMSSDGSNSITMSSISVD